MAPAYETLSDGADAQPVSEGIYLDGGFSGTLFTNLMAKVFQRLVSVSLSSQTRRKPGIILIV